MNIADSGAFNKISREPRWAASKAERRGVIPMEITALRLFPAETIHLEDDIAAI